MRLSSLDFPDLSLMGFRRALGKNRPATLEKSSGSAPQAPDPNQLASLVNAQNQNAAAYNKALNLGNYSNAFGSQQSTISGYDPKTGAPIYQTNISANPQLQALLNQQMGNIGNAQGLFQGAIGGLQGLNTQLGGLNADAAMKEGRDAYYRQASAYLDPRYAQEQASLDAKLAAQGLAPGSQAYSTAYGNFQRDRNFAYDQAMNSAITQGQQLGLNQLQAQQGIIGQQAGLFGQQLGASQLPYSNLQSIASLIPGYSGVGSAGTTPADIASALNNQYQGQLGAYNAQQQSRNALMNSLGGLATSALFGGGGIGGLFGGSGGGLFGGAGSALSSISPALAGVAGDALGMSLGGTYGAATQAGLDSLIASLGGFGAEAGAGAGAAAAGGSAAGGGAASGAASGTAGGLGAAAGAALPAAVLIGGVLSMFQPGTQPEDIAGSWKANQGGLNSSNFRNFVASDPALSALVDLSTQGGSFDLNRFNDALNKATVGGKQFSGQALNDARSFGQYLAQNPQLFMASAPTQEAWWSPYAQGTPSN